MAESGLDQAAVVESGLDQFFTDPELAKLMAAWALRGRNLTNTRLLEPSAGDGALVRGAIHYGMDPKNITAVEKSRDVADPLLVQTGADVVIGDFRRWRPSVRFDLALMNPPYRDGRDVAHVFRALCMADRVVVLCLASFCYSVGRYETLWSRARVRRRVVLAKRPKYYGPDTGRHTAQYDYQILDIEAHEREPGQVDQVQEEIWYL